MKTPVRTDDTVTDVTPGAPENLADLAKQAAAVDAGAASAAPGAQLIEAEPAATLDDIAGLLCAGRDMAAPGLEAFGVLSEQQVRHAWSDEALKKIAGPLLTIMERHDMGLAEVFEKFGPYVILLAAVVGPSVATLGMLKANQAATAAAIHAKQQQQSS